MSTSILVIEDEPEIREMIGFSLNRAGYDVVEAETAEEALSQLDQELPELAIIDWMLPGMSGVELSRRLRRDELTKDIPIIMLTARSEESDKLKSFDSGVDDYITKPFSPRELTARIKALLRRAGAPEDSLLRLSGICLDLQSHRVSVNDEVVHGKGSMIMKMAGEPMANKAHQLRLLYALMWLWPGKKTLFMGSDFGQSSEWKYNASLDWHLLEYIDHRGIQLLLRDLNHAYRNMPAIAKLDNEEAGFEWINCTDGDNSVLSFLRKGKDKSDTVAAVGNFTPVRREGYRVGVPHAGFWKEIINTDAKDYGGQGFGNCGGVEAEAIEWDGRPYSIKLEVPPFGMTAFRCQG